MGDNCLCGDSFSVCWERMRERFRSFRFVEHKETSWVIFVALDHDIGCQR